jgi:membrane protein DedA with SNARE-associated domain
MRMLRTSVIASGALLGLAIAIILFQLGAFQRDQFGFWILILAMIIGATVGPLIHNFIGPWIWDWRFRRGLRR